ncbi:MAG: Molybdopterin molybdenumtransferase [Actinobacteria bacterium ADurb.Bin346]|nr:MAG: Molybdopterin molybdenumtransferase [Actinobacteria bacterium ADurb.Bin346]
MLSVKEAREKVISSDVNIKTGKVPILESLHLILAENLVSENFVPAFDNSAVDGYAVNAVDIIGADKNYPVKLKLFKEDIPAGKVSDFKLEPGICVQIMTGAPIPQGCDCVVMKEDALKEGKDVLVFKECRQGENIRCKGEDIKKGNIFLKKGLKIYPADIGLMSSTGISEVCVNLPPVVGILSTGDELINIEEKLSFGKVRDSNSYSLAAQVLESGAKFRRYGTVADDRASIKKKVLGSLQECEILLITGGVSVGDYDYVRETLDDIGAEFVFWRVSQKPGKPFAFLNYKNRFIFCLPGSPVSAMICFEIYVRPLIKKIMGDSDIFRRKIAAKALEDYEHNETGTDFIRVFLEKKEDGIYFRPTGMQGSGILTSMSLADGIAIFPEGRARIEKDSEVDVIMFKQ